MGAAAVMLLLAQVGMVGAADKLKPFVLGSVSSGGHIKAKAEEVKGALAGQGFTLVGEYAPYDNAYVIVATSDALKAAAGKTKRGGYGAVVRIGITQVGDQIQVAYVNPVYIQNAYRMDADLSGVADKLAEALGNKQAFGSEDGLKPKALRKYHYMIGMEYFVDPYELGEFASHEQAVKAIEKGLAEKRGGVSKVYRLDLPGDVTLFGVSMSAGPSNDKYRDDTFQMGVVDFKDLKGTAYLPYEILVRGNEVEALHMRFRMAVHFPDLSMMGDNSFMRVKASPPAIEKALLEVTGKGDDY
jgi:hypothetical protein